MSTSTNPSNLSRRQLLQAAGGVTLLTLVPRLTTAESEPKTYELPAPTPGKGRPPVFTALPYLQPGPASKLVSGDESIVIAWQTDDLPADFEVSYGERSLDHAAVVSSARRLPHGKEDGEARINYSAAVRSLKLNTKYRYRVSMSGATIMEGFFTTRKPRGFKTRFVAFGDNSYGDISDRAIAFQAFKAMPDFVMNAGDNVYESGLDNEYARYFFPVYNADQAGLRIGAPLLRAVPFYTVIANHDVHGKDADKNPVADFDKNPDSLGYFSNMYLPLNGPEANHPTPAVGNEEAVADFKNVAGERFPRMANYSFDYGDAHFLCLDSNVYVDPTDPALQAWIESDLAGTDAAWKLVVYHHPAFNVGNEHYAEQHMRVLAPLLEKHGVSIVFSGHEHNYQRTRPIRFAPRDESGAKKIGKGKRLVPGDFSIDRSFDGAVHARPVGVIYLTTGAGGKHLYDPEINENPKNWLHEEDGNADYVARVVSDRHSITVVDVDSRTLIVRQVDEWGNEIDHFGLERS
ncbi:MAG TPA: metallophosphoesterase [Fimbriimonadaceae bacterium]|nr:metallophosphoesterase [Fimbriimonadaceae bacterium]